jgi:hypothetical protein
MLDGLVAGVTFYMYILLVPYFHTLVVRLLMPIGTVLTRYCKRDVW